MSIITTNRENRAMVFVDLRNVLRSVDVEDATNFRLDLCQLAKQLAEPREIVGAYVFDTKAPEGDDRNRPLHDKLRACGFRLVARDFDANLKEQKEVDVAMACEILSHALKDHYDVAIIVSGDRDFIPVIEHVQAAGKKVEVASFAGSASNQMRKAGDVFHDLDQIPLLTVFAPIPEESAEAPRGVA